jgi:light-harvesting protein B-800-850 alpha chain
MINGKMWLVVKPTVGLPIFFIGIVVASLSVHTALLFNTTWFPAFLRGGSPAPRAELMPGTALSAAETPGSIAIAKAKQAAQ